LYSHLFFPPKGSRGPALITPSHRGICIELIVYHSLQ
jgi:hypothetical protein